MIKANSRHAPESTSTPADALAAPVVPVGHEERSNCWLGLLSAREAAQRLGITTTTLYAWLGLSDRGLLVIRGRSVTIDYFQGGPAGQGRIRIEPNEVERLKQLMRVQPQPLRTRRPAVTRDRFPGITVPLGKPG